jgi:excisionase family DNA binding protein
MIKNNTPTKQEQLLAREAIEFLEAHSPTLLNNSRSGVLNLTIEEQAISLEIPRKAFNVLIKSLREMSEGGALNIESSDSTLTTQEVANRMGASRPHIVKLLERGEIKFIKVGCHRRVKLSDFLEYKRRLDNEY